MYLLKFHMLEVCVEHKLEVCYWINELSFILHACSVVHLCPTKSDPMDCNLPDSSAHGFSSRNTGVAFFNLALSFVLYCNSIWNQGDGLFILANGRSRVNLGINHCSQKDSMLWLVRSDTNHCVQENKMLWLVGVSHMVIRNESSDLGR